MFKADRNALIRLAGLLAIAGTLAQLTDGGSRLFGAETGTSAGGTIEQRAPAAGPLVVHPDNPRYLAVPSGEPVVLTGSHTWSNLVDNGGGYPPPAFDYDGYLDFLEAHNHNFFRLWNWEQARWSTETSDDQYWYGPLPWPRAGSELALDGLPRHDVSQVAPEWLERVRSRAERAGERGFYVSVMLFNGWSVSADKGGHAANNPWRGHPMHRDNNVNGLDGDPDGTGSGEAVHSLRLPAVTAVQLNYVRTVVEYLNDLDNVLYEISNESHGGSEAWQYEMIEAIRDIEAGLPQQHLVGMTVEWPGGDNGDLFASPADWISPNGSLEDPPAADGRKVIVADTDHLCGICGDRHWAWKAFTRGQHPIFMDGYDGEAYGSGGAGFDLDDPQWVSLRENLGTIRGLADDLASEGRLVYMAPEPQVCSTGFCLAGGDEETYTVVGYLPEGGRVEVDVAGAGPGLIEYAAVWLDPSTGRWSSPEVWSIDGGVDARDAPHDGDAVLVLRSEPLPTPTASPTDPAEVTPPVGPESGLLYLPFSTR